MEGTSQIHPLLKKQLKRSGLDINAIQATPLKAQWDELIKRISQTYWDADQERYLLDRSIDISTRELMTINQSLQEKESRLELILDGTPDAMIIVSPDGEILMLNQQAVVMFGYSKKELLHQQLNKLIPGRFHQRHDRKCKNFFEAPTVRKMSERNMELLAINKQSKEFPVEISLSPIGQGNNRMTLAAIRDISERKQAETELRELNAKLLEMSRQFGMAEIATAVLHNVGNVMNSINVSIEMALEKLKNTNLHKIFPVATSLKQRIKDEKEKLLPEYLCELLDHAKEDYLYVAAEIKNIADKFSHIKDIIAIQLDLAGITGAQESILPEELIEQALQLSLIGNISGKIILEKKMNVHIPILIDKQKIMQVLVNVLRNAWQSVQASKNLEKKIQIQVDKSVDDQLIIFTVSDTGLGIIPDHLDKIFNMGFTTKAKGHGYGLHTSAIFIKELEGTLHAKSDGEDKGATFILTVPIKRHVP